MPAFAQLAGNGSMPASINNPLDSNGTTLLDKLMGNGNTMTLYTDARMLLPVLLVFLGVVLKGYQILIAKRTLAVLQDIKGTQWHSEHH